MSLTPEGMGEKDGGPAFPLVERIEANGKFRETVKSDGMSLRDYFAATVPLTQEDMKWIFGEMGDCFQRESAVRFCKADAMLAERAKVTAIETKSHE